jgi:hypothetical protein
MGKLHIKNSAHDKAFANIHTLDNDISRLKQEIIEDKTPFLTIEQLEGVLRRTEKEKAIWNYLAKLIELDHERIDYLEDHYNSNFK